MPAHEGLRADNRDGLEDRRKPSIQLDEKQTVTILEAVLFVAVAGGAIQPNTFAQVAGSSSARMTKATISASDGR
jgi:hypothetical protein